MCKGKKDEDQAELSESVHAAIRDLMEKRGVKEFTMKTSPVSAKGENSYGLVLRLKIISKDKTDKSPIPPCYFILKMSPKNQARRKQMKVVEHYTREVFMYEHVLEEFKKVQSECNIDPDKAFNSTPKMYFSSLTPHDEFIIFEDLHQTGYLQYGRKQPLTPVLTSLAVIELAKFHAMSFILKNKNSETFYKLVDQVRRDNLFTEDIEQISIEFAKKYIRRTMNMIEEDDKNIEKKPYYLEKLQNIHDNFVEICIKFVNGNKAEPYAVICHGDFWNNNILYRYDDNGAAVSAKIVDFQVGRYAPPVLDVVHYIFSCTEKALRDAHFGELLNMYYDSLSKHLRLFEYDPDQVYPRNIFNEQVKTYGVYGFCMSVFAIPFFISDSSDLPNFDEVAEAVVEIPKEEEEEEGAVGVVEGVPNGYCNARNNEKTHALLDEYELLTERTIPIFRRRMIGIVLDLDKYEMFENMLA